MRKKNGKARKDNQSLKIEVQKILGGVAKDYEKSLKTKKEEADW